MSPVTGNLHRVLILGAGRGGSALLEMLLDEPLVTIVGVADRNPQAPGMRLARERGIATFKEIETALHACAPCLAFNLTNDDQVDAVAASILSAGEVVGGIAARLLWKMVTGLRKAKTQLQFEATHDTLTGIYNRRHMLAQLHTGLAQAMRYCFPLAIAMIDLDRFKTINDTFGHGTGDAALKHAVRVIRSDIRETDTLGRWGGEEFLVILPHTTAVAATTAAVKWLEKLRASPLSMHDGREISLSFSAGVAAFEPDSDPASTDAAAEALVRLADRRLYAAKAAGRGRVFGPDSDTSKSSNLARGEGRNL